ncbi:LacI family transcriptional regulator [Bacillus sp. AFS029533]|nr:LacI family transcriptional regulator [Bacillus sp. AFS029533]
MIYLVSSHDVARLAGVSQATVSRVLNGSKNIRQSTVEKVERAIKELNYHPNLNARNLVKKKTNMIALITGHTHDPFYEESTRGIVSIAAKKGYNVLVFFNKIDNDNMLYNQVLSAPVDGIIMSSILMNDSIFPVLESLEGKPYVTFNRKHSCGTNYFEIDNVKAGELITNHMIELGHKNLAYIGGPLQASTFHGRLEGFKKEANRQKIAVRDDWIKTTDTTIESIVQACKELFSGIEFPTAIVAATDAIALICLDFLLNKGFKIPEDISIGAIDNIEFSAHASIQLTTVGTHLSQSLGNLAMEHLINLIENKNKQLNSVTTTITPHLIVRRSTGNPRIK